MRNPGAPTSRHGSIEYSVAEPTEDAKEARARITSRFVAFCRRHSIDEIPQFWHVLRGDMSLVGPRPFTRIELVRHYGAVKYPERAVLDLKLVRELTPRMYLTIILRTRSQH